MAEINSFPNNKNIEIGAQNVMKWLHGRTSGVFGANGNAAVTPVTGQMAVNVSDGHGWMSNNDGDGVVWWIDTDDRTGTQMQLAIGAASGTLNRIDRVIVEWKTTTYADLPEVKILQGTAATAPTPPTLTNSGTVRQISLASIRVPAGTTSITPGLITDERLNPAVCGIVTDAVEADTSVVSAQFEELIEQLRTAIEQAQSGVIPDGSVTAQKLASNAVKISFTNVVVQSSRFTSSSTYEDFPFVAAVTLSNVTEAMMPEVVFAPADAISGVFAPVAAAYNGGVNIYASERPSGNITIPTIICWR